VGFFDQCVQKSPEVNFFTVENFNMSSNLASKLRVGTKKAHTMAENGKKLLPQVGC
jgi:hypothetical protein